MKLGKQLILTFCIAMLLPLAIMWFWLQNHMLEYKLEEVRERHLVIAKNLGTALERYQRDIKTGFDVVATNLAFGNDFARADAVVSSMHFRHICIADYKSGKVVAQAAPAGAHCPTVVPRQRLQSFKSLLGDSRQIVISPALPLPDKSTGIFLLKRIGDKIGIGALTTQYFKTLGKTVAFGIKGHAAIVDQNGVVLAHPRPDWLAARKNISKISIVKQMLARKIGVAQFYSPAMKTDMIAGYYAKEGLTWAVMVPQPVSELEHAADIALGSIFPIIAACLLLAIVTAILISRQISKPLRTFIDGANSIGRGEENVEVEVGDSWHVPQEFQDLQKRFNAMAAAVSNYQARERERREAAERDSSNKAEYFANLAHELKTPLNSILGFSSVLKEARPGALQQHQSSEFLGHIEKSASHLLSFVNDLLDLNRLDMGAHTIDNSKFALIDPVRFCVATLRRNIEEKDLNVEVDCPQKNVKLFTDERALNQILINLLSNAVRYSFIGATITVSARLTNNGDVVIAVHDEGIGIPEEDIEKILQPFKRSSDPQIAEIHGTGLGLSIVTRLAALNDLKFTISSIHGFSTTAVVTIPAEKVIVPGANEAADANAAA